MSQLVRLEGKHSTQNAHCAVFWTTCCQKFNVVEAALDSRVLSPATAYNFYHAFTVQIFRAGLELLTFCNAGCVLTKLL